jgi:branched-chain amino acid transport system ATP-binding protein
MLYFDQVSTFYGKIQALHDISIEVKQGEIVTLIGANGAGKSTLLMTLCGSPQAASGSIRFQGEELIGLETPQIMRKSIAVVPEGRRVFARLTVEENLAMGGFFTDKEAYQAQMDKVLHLFPRLKERFAQRAGTMSGGEQQMLAIGRALMSQPKLLLLDEPSLGLAPIIIQQIFAIIEQLRSDGVTVFLVEQNANQALKLADRAYVLENGRIVTAVSPGDLSARRYGLICRLAGLQVLKTLDRRMHTIQHALTAEQLSQTYPTHRLEHWRIKPRQP